MPLVADVGGVGHDATEVAVLDADLVGGSLVEQSGKDGAVVGAVGHSDVASGIAVEDRRVCRAARLVDKRCAVVIATRKLHVHQTEFLHHSRQVAEQGVAVDGQSGDDMAVAVECSFERMVIVAYLLEWRTVGHIDVSGKDIGDAVGSIVLNKGLQYAQVSLGTDIVLVQAYWRGTACDRTWHVVEFVIFGQSVEAPNVFAHILIELGNKISILIQRLYPQFGAAGFVGVIVAEVRRFGFLPDDEVLSIALTDMIRPWLNGGL